MTRRESDKGVLLRYRLLLAAGVVLAGAIGFLSGRGNQPSAPVINASAAPGLADYVALTRFNHYSIVRATGNSMQPSVARYNYLLVRDTQHIQRGDIVVSRHHGIHRVVGLPGETIEIIGGRVRVCVPRSGLPDACRMLVEPWVRYHAAPDSVSGPAHLLQEYATVPDNRACCDYIVVVPLHDVIGIVVGSLLSYGALGPDGKPAPGHPLLPALVYDSPTGAGVNH